MIFRHYLDDLNYDDASAYAVLLADTRRVRQYFDAIDAIVKPEDWVVELGAGPGVFGRFAASRCEHVILVERAGAGVRIARLLNHLLGDNKNIEVVDAPIENAIVPRCNIIIHELIGGRTLDEGVREALSGFFAKNPWARAKDITLIPSSVDMWIKPVRIDLAKGAAHWNTPPEGYERVQEQESPLRWVTSIRDCISCGPWKQIAKLCFPDVDLWPRRTDVVVQVTQDQANAILWGFIAELGHDVQLDTRLGLAMPTTWGGTVEVLPLKEVGIGAHRIELALGGGPTPRRDCSGWVLDCQRV